MITAVICIGSNSIRMMTAELENGGGRRLLRDRAGTRLFDGIGADSRLSLEAMERTADAAADMARKARAAGAGSVWLFATSAVRDAVNAGELADRLRERAAVEMEVCTGEEEALLSFIGATDGQYCGVVDIGGGSTEIVTGQGERLDMRLSCQLGALRLFRGVSILCRGDVEHAVAAAYKTVDAALTGAGYTVGPEEWIGEGGTFTALAAMEKGVCWTDASCRCGTCLEYDRIAARAAELADMPVKERMRLPGVQPGRADIIVHGIAILLAVMDRLGIRKIRASQFNNLDGYLKRRYGLKGNIRP